MKSLLIRLFGGMVIGCLITVPYVAGSSGAEYSLSLFTGMSGARGSHEVFQGLILGLIAFILAGFGARWSKHLQRIPMPIFSVESHRQRRVGRLQRMRLRRSDYWYGA